MKKINLLPVIILLCAAALYGTSYSGPVKQTVYSADGKYFAVIDPESSMQKIFKASSPDKLYWYFTFSPELDTWMMSNNGEYVVCVRWRFVRAEDLGRPAIIVFSRKGAVTEYPYNTLVQARRTGLFETAPVGRFWRVWSETVKTVNNSVEITTHDRKRITVSGDDGKLSIIRE